MRQLPVNKPFLTLLQYDLHRCAPIVVTLTSIIGFMMAEP